MPTLDIAHHCPDAFVRRVDTNGFDELAPVSNLLNARNVSNFRCLMNLLAKTATASGDAVAKKHRR